MKLLNLALVSIFALVTSALITVTAAQAQTISEPEKVVRDTINSLVENLSLIHI